MSIATGSSWPVFPTKDTLNDVGIEYLIAFIVIVVLTVLTIFVVCLGLGYLFCSRKKRSEFNKEDTRMLAKDQVVLRDLPTKIKYLQATNTMMAVSSNEPPEHIQTMQEDNQKLNQLPKLVSPASLTPPPYQYPMHVLLTSSTAKEEEETL